MLSLGLSSGLWQQFLLRCCCWGWSPTAAFSFLFLGGRVQDQLHSRSSSAAAIQVVLETCLPGIGVVGRVLFVSGVLPVEKGSVHAVHCVRREFTLPGLSSMNWQMQGLGSACSPEPLQSQCTLLDAFRWENQSPLWHTQDWDINPEDDPYLRQMREPTKIGSTVSVQCPSILIVWQLSVFHKCKGSRFLLLKKTPKNQQRLKPHLLEDTNRYQSYCPVLKWGRSTFAKCVATGWDRLLKGQ